ncbi:hypothetical protein [Gaoshiqia sediminis]|uniref:Lipoprotein n=1 Tax=Gaoshiqia sediminis TaxID=2986998 RepID=A0AA41Y386_9BACT|nr:hypothetical protein [Gaoshiqia sediminis]MCW0482646.1 hypothetical protein [Gaoshiqia sediminis]
MKTRNVILPIVFSLSLISCQKNDHDAEGVTEEDIEIIKTENQATYLLEDLESEVDYFSASSESSNMQKSAQVGGPCAAITIDVTEETIFPVVVTVDYGDGCDGLWGHRKSGTIVITKTAPWFQEGAKRIIEFQNFVMDTVAVSGSMTITTEAFQQNLVSFRTVSNIAFTWNETLSLNRTADITRSLLAGFDTPFDITDNVIEAEGMATLTFPGGDRYTRQTVEPLVIMGSCQHIVSGILEIVKNGETAITVDYGDGTCDNNVVVSKDGESVEVELNREEN